MRGTVIRTSQIDEAVYELYGLTPEEITIVEGNNHPLIPSSNEEGTSAAQGWSKSNGRTL
jgi:hypothetical protein